MATLNRIDIVDKILGTSYRGMVELSRATDYDRRCFHDASHPLHVFNGAVAVGNALVGEKHFKKFEDLIFVAAMAHDVVQDMTTKDDDGFQIRVANGGTNEERSALYVREKIKEMPPHAAPGEMFAPYEIILIEKAILWTLAEFDPKLGTVIQPRLREALQSGDWHPVPVAIAMGDLLTAGYQPHTFLIVSDEFFKEREIEIDGALSLAKSIADIPEDWGKRALDRMRRWDESQIKFLEGRKKAFEEELSYFDSDVAQALRETVNKFDATIARFKLRNKRRSKLDLINYAEDMSFAQIPTS